jgi:hypothetical protein
VPVREACIFCYTQDVSIVNGVALWLTQLPSSCCCQHLILITSLKNQRWTLDGKNTTLLEKILITYHQERPLSFWWHADGSVCSIPQGTRAHRHHLNSKTMSSDTTTSHVWACRGRQPRVRLSVISLNTWRPTPTGQEQSEQHLLEAQV